jgi:hypothetical protein
MPVVETGTMALAVPPITSANSTHGGQPQPLRFVSQGRVNWLLAGPLPLPDDIRSELLQQRTNKTKTFVVAVLASLLLA